MEITEELIKKYFLQKCTSDERAAVSAWFDAHPEELDKYLDDASWQQFEPKENVAPALSEQMFDHIKAHIDQPEAVVKPIRRSYSWVAAAASVILIIGAGWFFTVRRNNAIKQAAVIAKVQLANAVNDTINNLTTQDKVVKLADGSVVTLSPQSSMVLHKNFVQPQRDIHLTGEGVFEVAKDHTRPFTVYAGGLSTTALGTRFRVTAFNNSNKVSVKLYNGKVVIKHHPATGTKQMEDVFLTPGMQLVWERGKSSTQVSSFTNAGHQDGELAESSKRTVVNGQQISFRDESVANVLNTLRLVYRINIKVDDALLANHTYTGTINLKTDAPADVLKTIAKLNGLTLTHQQDNYGLTR